VPTTMREQSHGPPLAARGVPREETPRFKAVMYTFRCVLSRNRGWRQPAGGRHAHPPSPRAASLVRRCKTSRGAALRPLASNLSNNRRGKLLVICILTAGYSSKRADDKQLSSVRKRPLNQTRWSPWSGPPAWGCRVWATPCSETRDRQGSWSPSTVRAPEQRCEAPGTCTSACMHVSACGEQIGMCARANVRRRGWCAPRLAASDRARLF
jgi:hypothetical protein